MESTIFAIFALAVPVLIVWFNVRRKINETNSRTQILLAALEKNPEMDMGNLLGKMSPKQKLLKEKLLTKHLFGAILTGIGVMLFIFALCMFIIYYPCKTNKVLTLVFIGLFPFATGLGFLVNYFLAKKMLAKEIETEERNMTQA